MKQVFLAVILICTLTFSALSATRVDTIYVHNNFVEKVLVEITDVNDLVAIAAYPQLAGAKTHRLFLDMYNVNYPNDTIPERWSKTLGFGSWNGDSIQNTPESYLTFKTNSPGGFYNNILIGGTPNSVNSIALWDAFPGAKFDSYLTDGRMMKKGGGYYGVPFSVDSRGYKEGTCNLDELEISLLPDISIFTEDSAKNWVDSVGYQLSIQGGSKGCSKENLVYIGQLTTQGNLEFRINFSIQDLVGVFYRAHEIRYNSDNTPPSIKLTSPVAEQVVVDKLTLNVEYNDPSNTITKVRYYINNGIAYSNGNNEDDMRRYLGSSFTAPFNYVKYFMASDTGNFASNVQAVAYNIDNEIVARSAFVSGVTFDLVKTKNTLIPLTEFTVYPNPVNDFCTLKFAGEDIAFDVSYSIYNMLGQKLFEKDLEPVQSSYTEEIDMTMLNSGLYILRINMDGGYHLERIIKR